MPAVGLGTKFIVGNVVDMYSASGGWWTWWKGLWSDPGEEPGEAILYIQQALRTTKGKRETDAHDYFVVIAAVQALVDEGLITPTRLGYSAHGAPRELIVPMDDEEQRRHDDLTQSEQRCHTERRREEARKALMAQDFDTFRKRGTWDGWQALVRGVPDDEVEENIDMYLEDA